MSEHRLYLANPKYIYTTIIYNHLKFTAFGSILQPLPHVVELRGSFPLPAGPPSLAPLDGIRDERNFFRFAKMQNTRHQPHQIPTGKHMMHQCFDWTANTFFLAHVSSPNPPTYGAAGISLNQTAIMSKYLSERLASPSNIIAEQINP